jgi:hypothetical protein
MHYVVLRIPWELQDRTATLTDPLSWGRLFTSQLPANCSAWFMIETESGVTGGGSRLGKYPRHFRQLAHVRSVPPHDRSRNFTLHHSVVTGVQTMCYRVCHRQASRHCATGCVTDRRPDTVLQGVSQYPILHHLTVRISILCDVMPCRLLLERNLQSPYMVIKINRTWGKKNTLRLTLTSIC